MLNQWVKRGWVVTKTDYEGLGTPGSHPYLVGASAARSAADICSPPASSIHPSIGRRWAVMENAQWIDTRLAQTPSRQATRGRRPDR